MNSRRGNSKNVSEKYRKVSELKCERKYVSAYFLYWLGLYSLWRIIGFLRLFFRCSGRREKSSCFWCGVCQKEKYVGSGERLQLSSAESNIFSLLPLRQVSAKNYTPVACLTAGHLGCYYCLLLSGSCIMYFIRHSTYMYIFSLGLFLFSTSIFQNVTENYLATHTHRKQTDKNNRLDSIFSLHI